MSYLHRIAYAARVSLRLLGAIGPARTCTVCGATGRFQGTGIPPRFDALCPTCGSFERHRLIALADQELKLFKRGQRLLHFAPEACLANYLLSQSVSYRSADKEPALYGTRTETIDITQMALPDNSFDVVVAAHVLEHVDDRRALSEMMRILVPAGAAVLMVPIIEGWPDTYENPAIVTPSDRLEHFGRHDHLRWYGRDFRKRLANAGFQVDEFVAGPAAAIEFGLVRGETVFIARRPSEGAPLVDGR